MLLDKTRPDSGHGCVTDVTCAAGTSGFVSLSRQNRCVRSIRQECVDHTMVYMIILVFLLVLFVNTVSDGIARVQFRNVAS